MNNNQSNNHSNKLILAFNTLNGEEWIQRAIKAVKAAVSIKVFDAIVVGHDDLTEAEIQTIKTETANAPELYIEYIPDENKDQEEELLTRVKSICQQKQWDLSKCYALMIMSDEIVYLQGQQPTPTGAAPGISVDPNFKDTLTHHYYSVKYGPEPGRYYKCLLRLDREWQNKQGYCCYWHTDDDVDNEHDQSNPLDALQIYPIHYNPDANKVYSLVGDVKTPSVNFVSLIAFEQILTKEFSTKDESTNCIYLKNEKDPIGSVRLITSVSQIPEAVNDLEDGFHLCIVKHKEVYHYQKVNIFYICVKTERN